MTVQLYTPPSEQTPIEKLTSPFVQFARMEAAGGILLLVSTLVALVWANSPWEHSYHAIWETQLSIGLGGFTLSESRHLWINDGLMSIFFFLVGLEIKREILIGELSSFRQAAFPLVGALGGTIVPACIYLVFNHGTPAHGGWGIPMATDIAFALGVLALLGNRVPVALKVFVAALAIVDDIVAVLIIAVFYTNDIQVVSLVAGLAGIGISFAMNLLGVRKPALYALIGILVWAAVLKSGVHATLAGVLLAFTIPARTYMDKDKFLKHGRWVLDQFEAAKPNSFQEHAAIHTLELECELVQSPLHRLEHMLQPWVGFVVMPLFAFSNAGVQIFGNFGASLTNRVALGVLLGLFVGKPLGIWSFAWLSTRIGMSKAPENVSWNQTFGASWLCGIGFTMSLFIATLAFNDEFTLSMAKIGILVASLLAGICGSIYLVRTGRHDATT